MYCFWWIDKLHRIFIWERRCRGKPNEYECTGAEAECYIEGTFECAERLEEMLTFYDEKGIKPVVDKVFGFEESKEALEYLFKGGHLGKVVIKVD